jgi:hypothetical protein
MSADGIIYLEGLHMSVLNVMKTLGSQHGSLQARDSHDCYNTDPVAVEALLKVETFRDAWEPACGHGCIAEVLKKHGILARASDLYDYGYGETGVDFYNCKDDYDGDIITNPPYNDFIKFVRHALAIGTSKVAIFMPIRYLSTKERYYKLYSKLAPSRVHIFYRRIGCSINADFTHINRNSAIDYCWCIWDSCNDRNTYLDWID